MDGMLADSWSALAGIPVSVVAMTPKGRVLAGRQLAVQRWRVQLCSQGGALT